MFYGPEHRTRRRIGTGLALAVALLLLGLGPAGVGAGQPVGPGIPPGALLGGNPSASAQPPFAERAGYSPQLWAGIADAVPAVGSTELVVTFAPTNPAFFAPPPVGSAPLTMAEIADRFGLTSANYTAAIHYFEGQGLSVLRTSPNRLSLSLVGSDTVAGRAFGTSILSASYAGRNVTFPASAPALPASLEAEVAGVIGLSSGFDTFTLPSLTSDGTSSGNETPAQGTGDLVTPAIARSIYDLSDLYNLTSTPTYATSRSIAVILWGVGYAPSDLATFFQQDYPSNFPAPTIVPKPIDGAPSPSSAALDDPCKVAQEMTLDLEWSGSMAPGATLYAVYPPESGPGSCQPSTASMADAMNAAVQLPVAAISMSFGAPETSSSDLISAWNTDLATAAQEGITLLAATGDDGGYNSPNCPGGGAAQYPASSPEVLAIGGTDVSLDRNLLGAITGFSESAWNSSGGGFSTEFAAPSWQSGTTGSGQRGLPDVAATAAQNYLYYDGASRVAGGTSFATPLWAGLITEMAAMHGSSLGLIAPRLYAIGNAEPTGKDAVGLADITTGSTCLGPATPGWDPETGWGSPRALLLYEDLTATFVSLSLAVAPGSVAPSGSVTISAHLANETTGAPIVGVPVSVSLSSSTNLGPCTGTFGSSVPTTDADGNVSVAISVPACYLGSHASAQVEVISDGYYGTNSTSIEVNLLAFLPFLSGITMFPYNVLGFVGIFAVAIAIGYVLGLPRKRRQEPGNLAPTGATGPLAPVPPSPGSPAPSEAPSPSHGPAPAGSEPPADPVPTPQKP